MLNRLFFLGWPAIRSHSIGFKCCIKSNETYKLIDWDGVLNNNAPRNICCTARAILYNYHNLRKNQSYAQTQRSVCVFLVWQTHLPDCEHTDIYIIYAYQYQLIADWITIIMCCVVVCWFFKYTKQHNECFVNDDDNESNNNINKKNTSK